VTPQDGGSGDAQLATLPTAGGTRVPAMDGLRGIAVLAVMIFHFDLYGSVRASPVILADRVILKVVQTGWIGADLFFVLSGFLITGILYDSAKGRHSFRSFYARRGLRTFPL
jgi:peptidoglycan/LPS O-acetylase OafA/YrhL